MYSLIYAYFYQLIVKRKSISESKDYGALMVGMAIFTHLILIATIIGPCWDLFEHLPSGRYKGAIIGIPLMIASFVWCGKKSNEYISKYKDRNLVTFTYTIIVLAAIIIPFVLSFFIIDLYRSIGVIP